MISSMRLAWIGSLTLAAGLLAAEAPPATGFIPAGDPRIRYEGRIDFTRPASPVIIWQGSRISLDFDGDRLALWFLGGEGQNYFDAAVDDTSTVVTAPIAGGRVEVPLKGAGRHHLVLFKRNEAASGYVRFQGLEVAPTAHAWAPPAPAYRLRMEFLGDSITAGACNEDGPTDQWEDRRTHNNARSYGTLTAAAFAADYRCMAVSGMGIAEGWTPMTAAEVWDHLYPAPASPRADLTQWQPDVAFLNLGENDDSFSRARQHPFPPAYTSRMVELVKSIRAAYPRAHLVLLRGGMFGGSQSAPLREAWTAAVSQLESGDPNISHFVFTHWTSTHPRAIDDRVMADELIAWLKAQPFMRPAG